MGFCFLASVALNIFLVGNYVYVGDQVKKQKLSSNWAEEAAAEAEAVALISCSGHGKAYLDGLTVDGKPVCECNTCYGGPDCSLFSPDSAVDALGKYFIFGGGATQLLTAAVYALTMNLSSPAKVVAAAPTYPLYKAQIDFFQNMHFEYDGDALLLKNSSDTTANVIEFVTSPNNPDGNLREVVSQGPLVRAIYDHVYYWPHFTAIPAPANEDVMIFTISKFTGHAGSRLG
ncbi:Tryptophan aminotransferase-related protein 4 [Sesamum alatum]|uniref:Tryptophan aminotransferase-related protein 4 n=1 Tax=Sesamum alatum TaxID=300844 RepID=A0AAE1YDX8_9LAMI|nr:Tryptophan aminotransferase-related protein 4 [Sesamum alatum]